MGAPFKLKISPRCCAKLLVFLSLLMTTQALPKMSVIDVKDTKKFVENMPKVGSALGGNAIRAE